MNTHNHMGILAIQLNSEGPDPSTIPAEDIRNTTIHKFATIPGNELLEHIDYQNPEPGKMPVLPGLQWGKPSLIFDFDEGLMEEELIRFLRDEGEVIFTDPETGEYLYSAPLFCDHTVPNLEPWESLYNSDLLKDVRAIGDFLQGYSYFRILK